MRNIISPYHSLNKRNFKQIKIYPDPKRDIAPSPRNKPFINNIPEICNSIYEDFFPYILKLSKKQFFERFNKEADEIFLSSKFNTTENIKLILESKENIIKKYDNDFKYLYEEYQNFLKNPNNYQFLTHFRKHCVDTDYYALHYCSFLKKGKFIEIKDKSSENKGISYVICESCRQCYLSKFILMLCEHCNRKYFSNILKENEDGNILPATWKKYHCTPLINAIMKCIKCKSVLYYNLIKKELVCLNKKCNFSSKPESILWVCYTCAQEFRSSAKIYNPLEFQILKKAINYALLKQIRAAPGDLPCRCKKKNKNLSKLIFFHKEECKGELYKGILLDKPILVCSKCKAINFEDKFTWICPICNIKFHLHRVMGCKPFSKKKYIINKSYNKSARNVSKKILDKETLQKNLLSCSIPNIRKDIFIYKSINNNQQTKNSKLVNTDNLNNINNIMTVNNSINDYFNNEKFYKKIEPNKIKNNKNENNEKKESNKVYDYKKRCWIINLKKTKNKDSKYKKLHTTLKEILQKRMNSESKEGKTEINKINKTMLPQKRITNHNIIKRRKEIKIDDLKNKYNSNNNNNKIIIKNMNLNRNIKNGQNIAKSINKEEKEKEEKEKEEKEKEDKTDKNIFDHNNSINFDIIKKGRRNIIRLKFQKKLSPFKSEISLHHNKKYENKNKNNNNDYKQNDTYETTNISISKTLNNNGSTKNTLTNNLYSSVQNNSTNNNNTHSLKIFQYWKRRGTTNSNDTKNDRFSKLNDLLIKKKINTEPSYNENNTLLDTSKKQLNDSNKSSFVLSFLGNNSILKLNNNINNHSLEQNEINEIKQKGDSQIYSEKIKKEKEKEKRISEKTKTKKEKETKSYLFSEKTKKDKKNIDLVSEKSKKIKEKENEDLFFEKIKKYNNFNSEKTKDNKEKSLLPKEKYNYLFSHKTKKEKDNSYLFSDKTKKEKENNDIFKKTEKEKDNSDLYSEKTSKDKENSDLYSEKTSKENNHLKESEEISNYSDEKNDQIFDLKKLLKKESDKDKDKDKENNFNDSDIYEKKETFSSEELEEDKDTIKDVIIKPNAKKNFRESLILKSNFIKRQSILISQDKLNNLIYKADIPTINENEYDYLKPIGEGTYGVVYLVENIQTSEQYALKKIICRDYNELIKHKNELELIFSVKHENILKLYGVQFKYLDETTSAIYVLMELAQNDWNKEIKRRILARKYYKEYELIQILKQIIKGFLFLQDKNIAHRDIKPQNILLFPNNVYKIADFGEAKFVKNIAEQSTLRGSELYMSPLLYKGYKYNQKNVLHNPFKSDVFSLGYCLLYAMSLNLKVLEVVRELTTMKSIISSISKYIAKNKYSEKLINIVYKMIEPNEDLRFDFEDLSVELEKL